LGQLDAASKDAEPCLPVLLMPLSTRIMTHNGFASRSLSPKKKKSSSN